MYEGCYPGWVLFKRLFDDDFLSISSRNSTRRITEINPLKISAHKRNSKSQTWFNREYFWSISSSFEPIHWWNEKCSCWYSNNSEHGRKIFRNFVSKNVTRRTAFSNTRRQSPGVDFKCRILFGLSQGEFLTKSCIHDVAVMTEKSARSFDYRFKTNKAMGNTFWK